MINVRENLKKLNSIYLKELKEITDKVIESGWYIWVVKSTLLKENFQNFVI